MYESGNLAFVFGLDGDAVSAVAHGDDIVLKILAGRTVYDLGQCIVDPFVRSCDLPSNGLKLRRCIVSDLIFGDDTSSYLPRYFRD